MSCAWFGRQKLAIADQIVDLPFPELATSLLQPGLIFRGLTPKGGLRHRRQILAGMIPINDLHGIGEVMRDQLPNPDRAITDKNQLFREIGIPLASRRPKELRELFSRLDVTGIANVWSYPVMVDN